MEISNELDFDNCLNINLSGYKLIFEIENRLRFFVMETLKNENKNWWENFKDNNFAKQVEMVKRSDGGNIPYSIYEIDKKIVLEKKHRGINFMLMHDIYYTNLMDLELIIKEYWVSDFETVFGGENIKEFSTRLKFVSRLRNNVMHSKPITNNDLMVLKHFRDFLSNKLNATGKDYYEFINCFSIDGILQNFINELNEHHERFDNWLSHGEFIINVYNFSIDQWWWGSRLLNDYTNLLNEYYKIINEVNETITNYKDGLTTEFKVNSSINKLQASGKCNQLIDILSQNERE